MTGELYGLWLEAASWAKVLLGSLGVLVAALSLFVLINGRSRLEGGYSGRKILRWSLIDRAIHWGAGLAFLLLLATGLLLAAGRFVLMPPLEFEQWAHLVTLSMSLHDFMAGLFIVGWLAMTVKWARRQLPEASDIQWVKSAGGYLNFGSFKGRHPDAGFANAGEKLWFWTLVSVGAVMILSGLAIMLPSPQCPEVLMPVSVALHLMGTLVLACFVVVHVFMATVISEGGLQSMISGQCDENWARQHHNLWLRQLHSSRER